MEYFEIRGGDIAEGEITPSGNKNEALPVLAASLLAREKVIIENLPDIIDVRIMLEIMEDLGAKINRISPNTIEIDSSSISDKPINRELCGKIRTSILFAGPLLARNGSVILPPPGGDIIGRRRLDTHFLGFSLLGAIYQIDATGYRIVAKKLRGADIFLDEASVTGTENIIMAAVCAEGTTIIYNAACEPHVQGLCKFLNLLGAKIDGIGTNRLVIEGVESLKNSATHRIGPDYIESGSFIALAAVTGGELIIKNTAPSDMKMVLSTYAKLGITTEIRGEDIFVPHHSRLIMKKEINNAIPKIDDGIWPAFPSDLMSIAIVIATQAEGTVLFFEKMFESRMFFVDKLISMGGQIILCDPHRVVVSGPSPLYGATHQSPDIRAGMALLIAAIAAKGKSTINNIQQIDRGYEKIDQKLQSLGVCIERRFV